MSSSTEQCVIVSAFKAFAASRLRVAGVGMFAWDHELDKLAVGYGRKWTKVALTPFKCMSCASLHADRASDKPAIASFHNWASTLPRLVFFVACFINVSPLSVMSSSKAVNCLQLVIHHYNCGGRCGGAPCRARAVRS